MMQKDIFRYSTSLSQNAVGKAVVERAARNGEVTCRSAWDNFKAVIGTSLTSGAGKLTARDGDGQRLTPKIRDIQKIITRVRRICGCKRAAIDLYGAACLIIRRNRHCSA